MLGRRWAPTGFTSPIPSSPPNHQGHLDTLCWPFLNVPKAPTPDRSLLGCGVLVYKAEELDSWLGQLCSDASLTCTDLGTRPSMHKPDFS